VRGHSENKCLFNNFLNSADEDRGFKKLKEVVRKGKRRQGIQELKEVVSERSSFIHLGLSRYLWACRRQGK